MAVLDNIITINKDLCKGCGTCARNCPVGAVSGEPGGVYEIDATVCVNCGYCFANCPFDAIDCQSDKDRFMAMVKDPNTKVAVQFSPSVRVAVGEKFGMEPGTDGTEKIVAALKQLGVDYVYDTNVSADLTILEEATEFVERMNTEGAKFPMFTSCCPAWVRYAEKNYPKYLNNISTCRSPMQMYSPVIKDYHRNALGEEVKVCAIMPCTAKKYEAKREEMFEDSGNPVTDLVLTTVEASELIAEAGIDFTSIEPIAPEDPFGYGTGGAVIFGTTGGVAEAVIRYVANVLLGVEAKVTPQVANDTGVRGYDFLKEARVQLGDKTIKIAVIHGLMNVSTVMDQIDAGAFDYDLIEIMACPYGCVGGAGMPKGDSAKKRQRGDGLFVIDENTELKSSNENPAMDFIYDNVVKGNNHHMLHTHYKPYVK